MTPRTSSWYILPEVEVVSVPRQVCNTRMSWHQIKSNNRWIKFYTDIPTSQLFMFIANQLRSKHQKLHYYNGFSSSDDKDKKYQISPVKLFCQKKPGLSRMLSLEDEILMTLMRIRLDSPIEDLSFRFQMSPANVCTCVVACICNPAKRRLNGRTVRVRIPSGERLLSRWVPIFKRACNPI